LLLYFDSTTNQRSIPFGYLLHLLVQNQQGTLLFSGVFIDEEVDGIGDRGSEHNTTVDDQTISNVFSNMSLTTACFNNEAFSGKKYWIYCPGLQNYQDFRIIG
jgi:hypothetical protein